MSGFTTGEYERAADHLASAEIASAINTLGDGEKTAIVKIARLYARKTRYGHDDLLQEAYCRVLDGRRRWLTGVPPLPFFQGVMPSIALEWTLDFPSADIDIG